jgi:hypothetical protein
MPSKSVKFEIELRGLKVKFEGDVQIAERFTGEIASAVNNLASAQQRLLPAPVTRTVPPATPQPGRRGRRRKHATAGASVGIDPSVIDGTVEPTEGEQLSDQPRRRATAGRTALLTGLKDDGFFAAKRSIADIRAALAAKGHTLKSSDISPTLVALTKKQVLKREKNSEDQWAYFA